LVGKDKSIKQNCNRIIDGYDKIWFKWNADDADDYDKIRLKMEHG
jgi:hypothetical protein